MYAKAISPPEQFRFEYAPASKKRAAELEGTVSVGVRDLFDDIEPANLDARNLPAVRKATEKALAGVDMSRIKPENTVNIVCNEHIFSLMGDAYAEMIRTIKDTVEQRTGCKKLRLRLAGGMGLREAKELLDESEGMPGSRFKLGQYFHGKVKAFSPLDRGVPIETEIGTLYGLADAYDGDYFILAYFSDPREFHLHRMIERAFKPFGMALARLETRAILHMNFGNRSSFFVARAIYNSAFVQSKLAFNCFLMSSPSGITGIDADNDLLALNNRLTISTLESYGKLTRLFAEIDECIVIIDEGGYPFYTHAGGVNLGVLGNAERDTLDLNVPSAMMYNLPGTPESHKVNEVNPAIKAVVINHAWTNIPTSDTLYKNVPTILVGRELADRYSIDSKNPSIMDFVTVAETLEAGVDFARRISGTDKMIVFDGALGGINVSQSMAELLIQKAPSVSRKVDEELLPMWLKQRGMDSAGI